MARLEALLFDVDGTLADTERDGHRIAFNRAFADAGLGWDWNESLYSELLSVTGGKERIAAYMNDYQPDLARSNNPVEIAARLHAAKTTYYLELLRTGSIPLRPGVERLLREARAENLRLAIATTTTLENVTVLLEKTLGKEAVGWFEVIAAGDMVPNKKPAPDVFQLALQKLGTEAQYCIAFEDSENGLRSALGAGLKTVVTINDTTRHGDFTQANLVLDCLGEPGSPARVLQGDLPGGIVDVKHLRGMIED